VALYPCKECKTLVSSSARVCPQCGIRNPAKRRRIGIFRVIVIVLVSGFATIILFFVLPAMQISSDPDCGSSSTISVVKQIAQDNADNKLAQFIRSHSPPDEVKALENDYRKAVLPLPGSYKVFCLQDYCNPTLQQRQEYDDLLRATQAAQVKATAISAKIDQIWKDSLAKVAYDLDTIRMTAKDDTTRGVTCAAKISATVPEWGGASMDITYKVEQTTDGKLYVTVYGLK